MQYARYDCRSTVVVVNQRNQVKKSITYSDMSTCLSHQLIGLGVAQFAVGLLCLTIQGIILDMVIRTGTLIETFHVHGIWAGVLFLVTGLLGILAGIAKGKCQVIAFNVLSIMSTIVAVVLLIIACVVLHILELFQNFVKRNKDHYMVARTLYGMQMALVVFASIEIVCAIWSSIVCCAIGACCCTCGCGKICAQLPKNTAQVQDASACRQEQLTCARSNVDLQAATGMQQNSVEATSRSVALNVACN